MASPVTASSSDQAAPFDLLLPLRSAGSLENPYPIYSLLHTVITRGTFAGSVTYREGNSYSVEVSGVAEDLRLDELTGSLTDKALDGRLDRIAIESARLEDGELRHVEFSGRMSELQ